MHDAVVVDVHRVERLVAVDAGDQPVERCRVGRVAARRRDRDGHAGERRVRRVVEVTAEDLAHVAAADHRGEPVLLEQLEDRTRLDGRHRDRRVVHREDGAVLGRRAEHVAQPVELVVRQGAVVVLRHAGVERDDPQPAEVVHPVLRAVVVGVEEPPGVRRALVVVADHPHDLGAHGRRGRLDELTQPGVGVGLRLVREVTGEHQRLRHGVEPAQPLEGEHEPALRRDDAVLLHAVREQVDVAEVGDGEPRSGVLAVLHEQTLALSIRALGCPARRLTARVRLRPRRGSRRSPTGGRPLRPHGRCAPRPASLPG